MKAVTRTLILAASLASVQLVSGPVSAQIAQLPPDGSVPAFIPGSTSADGRCAGGREAPNVTGAEVAAPPLVSTTADPLCAAPSDLGTLGWSMPPLGDVTDRLGQFLQQILSMVEPRWSFWLLSLLDRLGPDLRGGPADVA